MTFRRILLCSAVCVLLPLEGLAQSWEDVSGGVTTSPTVPCVYAMTIYQNELYVAGLFGMAGNVPANNIARWNGSTWSPVGTGTRGGYANGAISCMAAFNGELYVGGFFDSAGAVKCNRIAKWNGVEWKPVGVGLTGRNNESTGIYTMIVFHNRLVIGGMFYTVDGISAGNIASFDGSKWTAVAGGLLNGEGGSVLSLAVHLDSLYAGGDFPGGPVVTLRESAWQSVRPGFQEYATSLCSYDDTLYAGGSHIYNNQAGFMKWDGLSWTLVKGPSDDEVLKMLVVGNLLYVSGRFQHIGDIQANMIASWDGQNWDSVGTGFSSNGFYSGVSSLATYQGYLYAGGNFTPYNNIARIPLLTNGVTDAPLRPTQPELEQNYPNPFNPSTTITFKLPSTASISLKVFDILGRRVRTLIGGTVYSSGSHQVLFRSDNLAAGTYYLSLRIGNFSQTRAMVLVK